MESGVHVLVEKPISTDIQSGQRLIDIADHSSVHLLVGHHRRFDPYISAAKAIIEEGRLGSITGINGMWFAYKPIQYFTSAPWRQGKGGGVFLINMVHEIDVLQYLLGPIIRVYAEKTVSHRGFDAEEGAAITFRFASGCVGSFLVSDHASSPYGFEAGTGENPLIPVTGMNFLTVQGAEGCLDVLSMDLWTYRDGSERSWHSQLTRKKQDNVGSEIPFTLQLQNFLEVVRGDCEARCTGRDGLFAVIVCEALKKSLQTEQPVYVEIIFSRSKEVETGIIVEQFELEGIAKLYDTIQSLGNGRADTRGLNPVETRPETVPSNPKLTSLASRLRP